MNALIQCVRRFNDTFPWNQLKPSLGKRTIPWLKTDGGCKVYDRVAGDLRMALDLSIEQDRWMYLNMYDIVAVQLLRRLLRPGDVVVDAGANIGYFTLIMAHRVGAGGRVYAFEPQPAALDHLRQNVALNAFDQVTVVPKGVWHEPGRATLHAFADTHMGEASLGKLEDRRVENQIDVELTRIDDEVAGPIRMAKFDVEGAELSALRGAGRLLFEGPAPHIIIELNPRTCKGFGYDPIELVDHILQRRPEYRLHLIRTRRMNRVTRDRVTQLLAESDKIRNLWLQPPAGEQPPA